jgi:hypothetical protein
MEYSGMVDFVKGLDCVSADFHRKPPLSPGLLDGLDVGEQVVKAASLGAKAKLFLPEGSALVLGFGYVDESGGK